MFTSNTKNGHKYVWEWHLCLSCFRMINLNTESHIIVLHDGFLYYAHINCRDLKPDHHRLERRRE